MTAVLALASALIVGSADYLSSTAARRTRPEAVSVLANLASLAVIVAVVGLVDAPEVRGLDVVWGTVAGVCGAIGFVLFLTAMARGQMGIVAPLAAVTGAATTVATGVLRGERPDEPTWLGLVLALAAIGVISATPGGEPESDDRAVPAVTPPGAVGLALAAGVGFGAFFSALSMTESDAGLWPLVPGRLAAIVVLLGLNLWWHRGWYVHPGARRPAVAGGALEAIASVLLLLAVRRGPLAVAGVLGSLYPVSTVLLAWFILGERLRRVQWTGVALALLAIPLISG